jgi:hypothetical protein
MNPADRDTVYVSDTPDRIYGNVLIEGPDDQCIYIHAGIGERCPRDAVAHTYIERGGEEVVLEMCAEHAPGDVPAPPSTEQADLMEASR